MNIYLLNNQRLEKYSSLSDLGCGLFLGDGSVVVVKLFIVAPIVCVGGGCVWSLFLYAGALCEFSIREREREREKEREREREIDNEIWRE